MKIQTKIWLATGLVLLVLLSLTSFVRYREIQANTIAELTEDAKNLRGVLMATRRVYLQQFLASGLPVNEKTIGFLPAHSLSRIAKDFPNWADSGISFNAVSDRPRNPDNRADANELQAMAWFRSHPKDEQRVSEITTADGQPYVHFAAPLYIEAYCLSCHGDRAAAPPSIRDTYSDAYGYQLGELRGILSIKIPTARVQAQALSLWRGELLINLAGYTVLFLVLGALFSRLVTHRLSRLGNTADAIAAGDYSQRSRQEGADEVSSLARAIDHMAEEVQTRDQALLDRERKISVILETAPVGVGVAVGQTIIEANDTLCKLLGYSREEMLALPTAMLYKDGAEAERIDRLSREQLDAAGACIVETCWRTRHDGLLDILLNTAPLVPADPSQGVVFSALDITERKHYQERLEADVAQRTADLTAALDAAKLADQAKDAFLANVSHELRTPLNAMIGMTAMARRGSTAPQQQEQLDKVIGAGKTLASLINDLLDLSKIVAGRMEFESTTFSLRGVVYRCNSVISYRAAEKGLKLLVQIDDDVPDALVGDPLRVEQILINLLSNAVKFTESGQIEIRIGQQTAAESQVGVIIEIEDTGIGMSEVHMAKLFQPFAQGDASMSRQYGGTGLGLSLCKHLAKMMGGEISVRSSQGEGSIFRVLLCLGLGDADDLPDAEQSGEPAVQVRYRDTRVLVAEDQLLNREIVEALLKLVGISVRMASNGQEALDILADAGPAAFDLVLMDIQMPVMDGLDATRELRSRAGFLSLPVIAMTAHTMTHEKKISALAGMNDHIGKPFDNASFYRTLARWIPESKQLAEAGAAVSFEVASVVPSLTGIDTKGALARFSGDEARYRHWLLAFGDEAPLTIRRIRQAMAVDQIDAARQVVHAFRGRVGMLGMQALHAASSELEAALKQDKPAAHLVDAMESATAQTITQIRMAFGVQEDTQPPTHDSAPPGPMPAAVALLVEMLDASDGGCVAAIASCLESLTATPWVPCLEQALRHAEIFDFAAAKRALAGDLPNRSGIV